MQLEYVDVVFANRPDSNTPMEGEWLWTRPWERRGWGGTGGVWEGGTMHATWEGEKHERPAVLDLRPLPSIKCFCALRVSVCLGLWQTHANTHTNTDRHIVSNLTILSHLLSSIVAYHLPFVSVGLLVSTGSLSCTQSQHHVLERQDYLQPPPTPPPLRGKLMYFWAGLTRYNPYCALHSLSTLVLPFPHIYLMSPLMSFFWIHPVSSSLLSCDESITVFWAPLLSYQPSSTGSAWQDRESLTTPTKIFSSLSPLPLIFPPL